MTIVALAADLIHALSGRVMILGNAQQQHQRYHHSLPFFIAPNGLHRFERSMHSLQSANHQRPAFSSHYLVRGHPLPSHPTTKQKRKFS
ncbi:hypothetical protein FXN63_10145 [Pigmentiphaga aceris]|uniref:Uncharacterized protein n=1 Tax=Pigmentiphaga aceris TaxID=1940612 RepID=A0A5C0AUY9_9BURK|nr:hypothetical protein [Pigmentiphaga aceris]QEI06158.1 hypothetical protein FXN63_10145 [Pigmentiphaga aceris]